VLRDSQSLSVFRSLARPNVSCAEWSPLAETVALATLEGSVLVWDVLEDQILLEKEFGLEISDLKFSPDGKTLVVLSKLQSFVAILALDSSRDVLFLPSPISSSSRCVQFSSHGRYCAIARRDLSGHKDIISILSTLDWKLVLVRSFVCFTDEIRTSFQTLR
jgi:WD40 repeat protein